MSLLTRYLVKEFLRLFTLCVTGGTVLYMVIDLFDRITIFIRNGADFMWVTLFLFYKIPLIIYQILPAAMLLSVLLTLGIMSRHNEIIALRTSGIPVLRIAYPFICIAMGVSIGTFFFNEYVVSPAYSKHEYMSRSLVEGKIPYKWWVGGKYWFKAQEGIYEIKAFQPVTEELYDITFFEIERPFRLARRIDAEKGKWQDPNWIFDNVEIRTFRDGMVVETEQVERKILPLDESPRDFQSLAQYTEELPYGQLRETIREIESEGYDSTPYRVEMNKKISFPILNMITALLGIPFALRLPKSGGIAAAAGISLLLGFLFWVLFAISISLGKTGILPPLVSAWSANILFLGLALYLLLRVEAKAIT